MHYNNSERWVKRHAVRCVGRWVEKQMCREIGRLVDNEMETQTISKTVRQPVSELFRQVARDAANFCLTLDLWKPSIWQISESINKYTLVIPYILVIQILEYTMYMVIQMGSKIGRLVVI